MTELEKQREAWERLENNLKKVLSIPWEEFDNIDSAKIPQKLDLVNVLHRDEFEWQYLPLKSTGEKKRVKRPSLHLNNGLNSVSIFYGGINTKAEKNDEDETIEVATLRPEKEIPRYISAIMDYLFGTIAFEGENLYLVNNKKFELLSELQLSERYKLAKTGRFKVSEVMKTLKFIHSKLRLESVKAIQTAVIACNDFQIDLKNKEIKIDTPPNPKESYFKVFDVNYKECLELLPLVMSFYDETMDHKDSLHNATLQVIYTMLVACRLDTKRHFFVSKSAERTGKSFRQDIISKLFESKGVELNNLVGPVSDIHWAALDGGEMLTVPESDSLVGMDRILKILATNPSHKARPQGGNPIDINLSGVLSIDTNEKISFSSKLSSRAVNIAFHDRPEGEKDKERETVFEPYWKAFMTPDPKSSNLVPTVTSSIAFLIHSFLYWQSEKFKINFRRVEMNNFRSTGDFGESQSYLLEHQRTTGLKYTLVNQELSEIMKNEFGRNTDDKYRSMEEIGRKYKAKKWRSDQGEMKVSKAWVIEDALKAQKAITAWIESLLGDD
ncbi:hypothetical protein [Lactococcus lactis]|uniref:hypothetical protein n=1 Tax=Lactococcus lactis TaxID=1358 RepID=UPI0022E060D0|nr:hypothetical protein [Lactococcus lactis]